MTLAAASVVLALALAGVGYELALPGVADAPARVASIVRARHGELATLPLPTRLAEAVVAVEDEHFYSNVFVNVFDGAGRAALASLERSGDPGGSTIAQQLAKQLYPHGPGLGGTLEEIGLGVKLSLAYSKPEILEMYLNAVYYGNGYWGDVAAARGYFGTSPDRLTWPEAAMLAGLPQAPSAYDPLHHFALAKQRQRHVLDQLVANHYLTAARAAAAYRARLPLSSPAQPGLDAANSVGTPSPGRSTSGPGRPRTSRRRSSRRSASPSEPASQRARRTRAVRGELPSLVWSGARTGGATHSSSKPSAAVTSRRSQSSTVPMSRRRERR